MKKTELLKQIADIAASARRAGDSVEINRAMPWVDVVVNENAYFFQGDEANDLIEEADNALDGECVAEDYILWSAQGW